MSANGTYWDVSRRDHPPTNTTGHSHIKHLTVYDFSTQHAAVIVWRIVSPLWLTLGTFGNILAIVVLLRKEMRSVTIVPYLLSVAVSDLGILYTGLLREWVRFEYSVDFQLTHVGCTLLPFAVYFTSACSSWMLTVMTIERFVCVYYPYKARLISITHRRFIVFVVIFSIFALHAHLLYARRVSSRYDPRYQKVVTACLISDPVYEAFTERIWPVLHLIGIVIIPYIVILFCNVAIISKMVRSRRILNRVQPEVEQKNKDDAGQEYEVGTIHGATRGDSGSEGVQRGVRGVNFESSICAPNQIPSNEIAAKTDVPDAFASQRNNVGSKITKRTMSFNRRFGKSMTILLVSVGTLFLVTVGPIEIFVAAYPHLSKDAPVEQLAYLALVWSILYSWAYLNYVANFFLYILTGPAFRKTLRNIMGLSDKSGGGIDATELNSTT